MKVIFRLFWLAVFCLPAVDANATVIGNDNPKYECKFGQGIIADKDGQPDLSGNRAFYYFDSGKIEARAALYIGQLQLSFTKESLQGSTDIIAITRSQIGTELLELENRSELGVTIRISCTRK